MESFESEEQNLVLDVLGNGETVKLGENRCNMISVGQWVIILSAEFCTIWSQLRSFGWRSERIAFH